MSLLHHRRVSGWIRGHLICRVEDSGPRFALTFDDGPSRSATPRILDLLGRRGARATFFTLAGPARRRPDLVRRMADEGHEPAIHGDRHWPFFLGRRSILQDEVQRSADAVREACGVAPRHYRPPFGLMTPGQAAHVRDLGYEPVLGDVYPEDPHRPGVERIVERVMRRLTGGSILILHDGSPLGESDRSQTIAALDVILARAAEAGLAAVTVRDLIEAPSATAAGTPGGR
jgi:peptidoglycan/xylan/chitin deacetylase (PgdA/CDA1 family)